MSAIVLRVIGRNAAITFGLIVAFIAHPALADDQADSAQQYVDSTESSGAFPIVQADKPATIYVDAYDYQGVIHATDDLAADIQRVTGQSAPITHDEQSLAKNTIIVGTLEKSALIKRLVKDGKIDPTAIQG